MNEQGVRREGVLVWALPQRAAIPPWIASFNPYHLSFSISKMGIWILSLSSITDQSEALCGASVARGKAWVIFEKLFPPILRAVPGQIGMVCLRRALPETPALQVGETSGSLQGPTVQKMPNKET